MRIWVDDIRPAPKGYDWQHARSVREAIWKIEYWELFNLPIDLINLDHDAGDYAKNGGDYIKLLDWLEETGRNYPIRIHSMNPVGRENMRRIIEKNGWKEIY